mmetsp:Transcript_51788/g.155409  ORF Transcript_51788/g.155409 Transcript_51788/m.155409 type:complete len:288 (+) Transcript_51788:720-1583(+)
MLRTLPCRDGILKEEPTRNRNQSSSSKFHSINHESLWPARCVRPSLAKPLTSYLPSFATIASTNRPRTSCSSLIGRRFSPPLPLKLLLREDRTSLKTGAAAVAVPDRDVSATDGVGDARYRAEGAAASAATGCSAPIARARGGDNRRPAGTSASVSAAAPPPRILDFEARVAAAAGWPVGEEPTGADDPTSPPPELVPAETDVARRKLARKPAQLSRRADRTATSSAVEAARRDNGFRALSKLGAEDWRENEATDDGQRLAAVVKEARLVRSSSRSAAPAPLVLEAA